MTKYKKYTVIFRTSTILAAIMMPVFLYCVLYVSPFSIGADGMPELSGIMPRTLSGFALIIFVILSRVSYKLKVKYSD